MLFAYPAESHRRKHGPGGYSSYESYKSWLQDEFSFRCVYCLVRESWYPNQSAAFGVDHVKPKGQAEFQHLECDYDNLVYACNQCNSRKQDEILIDPCAEALGQHI